MPTLTIAISGGTGDSGAGAACDPDDTRPDVRQVLRFDDKLGLDLGGGATLSNIEAGHVRPTPPQLRRGAPTSRASRRVMWSA